MKAAHIIKLIEHKIKRILALLACKSQSIAQSSCSIPATAFCSVMEKQSSAGKGSRCLGAHLRLCRGQLSAGPEVVGPGSVAESGTFLPGSRPVLRHRACYRSKCTSAHVCKSLRRSPTRGFGWTRQRSDPQGMGSKCHGRSGSLQAGPESPLLSQQHCGHRIH